MRTLHPLEQKLVETWNPGRWKASGVLVAVSGGGDSVALLRLMAAACGTDLSPLRVFHLNHMLRGAASDADEKFVDQLCGRLGIVCDTLRWDIGGEAQRKGESTETIGRTQRYAWLQQLAEQHGLGYVATAHTADDQVETILHRIVRGTGFTGLSGVPRIRSLGPAVTLVRPLIEVRRAELVAYLDSLAQPFCQDASNRDIQFMRNRIRHELLPLLRTNYNPGVDDALLRLGALAAELRQFMEPEVRKLGEPTAQDGVVTIDCRPLVPADHLLVRQWLIAIWNAQGWPRQAMGFSQWELLRSMIQEVPPSQCEAHTFPGGICARRDASTLTLAPPPADLT